MSANYHKLLRFIHQNLGDEQRTALAKGSIYVFALKIISLTLTLFTTILLARVLGPQHFGIYSFVLALVTVLSLPSRTGLHTLAVREVAARHATRSWDLMRGFFRWSISFSVGTSLFATVGLLAAAWLFRQEISMLEMQCLLWGAALIPIYGLTSLRGAIMRGLSEPVKGILLEATVRPGLVLISILLITAFTDPIASDAVALNLLATAVAFVGGTIWLSHIQPRGLQYASTEVRQQQWARAVIPLTILGGLQQLMKYTDLFVLSYFASADNVGIYRVAAQGAELTGFGLITVALVLGPEISRMHTMGDSKSMEELTRIASLAVTLFAAAVTVLLAVFGSFLIVVVFGKEYEAAYTPMVILCIGQLALATLGIAVLILRMTGYEGALTKILAGGLALNVTSNLFLVPSLGMRGAAIATTCSLILSHAVIVLFVFRHLRLNPTFLPLVARHR